MTAKTRYDIGDTVWIAGISRNSTRLTKGNVIKVLDLSTDGFSFPQYVIQIHTPIDSILEIRDWQTISEDDHGPVGGLRQLSIDMEDATVKLMNRVGLIVDEYSIPADPAPEQLELPIEDTNPKSKESRSRPRYRKKRR